MHLTNRMFLCRAVSCATTKMRWFIECSVVMFRCCGGWYNFNEAKVLGELVGIAVRDWCYDVALGAVHLRPRIRFVEHQFAYAFYTKRKEYEHDPTINGDIERHGQEKKYRHDLSLAALCVLCTCNMQDLHVCNYEIYRNSYKYMLCMHAHTECTCTSWALSDFHLNI